jgi:hypothetical protein
MGKYFESLLYIKEMRGQCMIEKETIGIYTDAPYHLFGLIRPEIVFFVCLFFVFVCLFVCFVMFCFVFVSSLLVCVSLPEIQSL